MNTTPLSVIMFTGIIEECYLFSYDLFESVNVSTETGNVGFVIESSIN